mmetsp:Transcript_958/g.2067  ORF Transcript_958/g.2067 Transcript_958/m.2067 type:complete len:1826 (+) Transcript_958:193-5670(+)|eukprot:CAMPEP_0197195786 /NCGR_PEP_ID=MMETSP1423-20130617/31834_1 /TAXON_ID=476441 /ORGANISM="Pseudo-nitzschia heimii, Strain UNC1101" /LENGTH=1825 /DNA_ID=CAMNT_0042649521 /DNA_START=156 /DNA_END=5633 /DNA_ORIENTATION=+
MNDSLHASGVSPPEVAPAVTGKNVAAILESARHLCEETRVVMTSLRGGPPNVARGDLAQDLLDLRDTIKSILSTDLSVLAVETNKISSYNTAEEQRPADDAYAVGLSPLASAGLNPLAASVSSGGTAASTNATTNAIVGKTISPLHPNNIQSIAPPAPPLPMPQDSEDRSEEGSSTVFVESPQGQLHPTTKPSVHQSRESQREEPKPAPFPIVHEYQDVGPYARPFLAVVMDPRAAGPHTLVALRALHRLLERESLKALGGSLSNQPGFGVVMEPLTKGVLNCKFEQTDAGADEAVEMAIADLLALMVTIDRRSIQIETLMDAFNTVFVTRNTFVHSPALCYHFEDVLTTVVRTVFEDLDDLNDPAGRLILEFLVNQLLHTPLVGGDDDASREAQTAHDATRVLCLRLTRCALKHGLKEVETEVLVEAAAAASPDEERDLLQIVQDDLCLSLLLTGQAIWAYHDNPNITPGFISLEVLSEICSTISTLWTSVNLRKHLVPQFEAIFSGFYQRALVLLKKRQNPTDSASFNANFVFDAGIEIILESLVEIMCLHDSRESVLEGNGACLEVLFATYDCNIRRSDVGVGLMIELCRCIGSKVNEEGEVMELSSESQTNPLTVSNQDKNSSEIQVETISTPEASSGRDAAVGDIVTDDSRYRKVPPHLKELCADSIIGSMKCLFRHDHPSESTKEERRSRDSIMKEIVSPDPQSFTDLGRVSSSHHLRSIKTKKRVMRKAAQLFNKKSSSGISFLLSSGIIAEPVTPRNIASFLRNGLVVGLDKKEVGVYLGEIGKPAVAGKSPKVWERDWFHKEVLAEFCSLFHFDRQSLLDGLRMFLASFRLPGEAQQIDRILQAFADSCGNLCEESKNGALKLFSEDPKRASDVAFLLSFSIIMLNTDQHNDNIREDRRMKKSDFVRNNTDYGKDITDPGKELPREYLEAIYDSIREEEIKTEGEGADGSMTVERWKDVLRVSAEEEKYSDDLLSAADAEDLSELVLEQVYMPIMSTISALWGIKDTVSGAPSGMHGAQGARLGMDIAWEMLVGVRQLGRNDIFCTIFKHVCNCSGLLNYSLDGAARSWSFANSVEAQGAAIIALHMIRDANSEIDQEGWKYIWAMIFELRDLKMIRGRMSRRGKSLLNESDPDLLTEESRREWTMKLLKKGKDVKSPSRPNSGILASMGRALFGSVEDPILDETKDPSITDVVRTSHGKEDILVWDDLALSDDEEEDYEKNAPIEAEDNLALYTGNRLSIGRHFENQLIQEDMLINQQQEMPVTGLERVEDTRKTQFSPRARARKRLSNSCDFVGLVSDSRFMDDKCLCNLLEALLCLISQGRTLSVNCTNETIESSDGAMSNLEKETYPLSPASEGFAEVLICEIALKNRDRLSMLWQNHLAEHYHDRLENLTKTYVDNEEELLSRMSGVTEKSITGLLRISCFSMKRGQIGNDVLSTWSLLDSCHSRDNKICLLDVLGRHIGEGLWRITRCVDDSSQLSEKGWHGILSLLKWSVTYGASLPSISSTYVGRSVGLVDDDPSIQVYRSLHYLLNVSEAKTQVPSIIGDSIFSLVVTGDRRNCAKLSIAALDLLRVLSNLVEDAAIALEKQPKLIVEMRDSFWMINWLPLIEKVASVSRSSSNPTIRQHGLSMLTDLFLDKQAGQLPTEILCEVLGKICIPLSGERIQEIRRGIISPDQLDVAMAEVDLCVGLIFKPLRHHVKVVVNDGPSTFLSLWVSMLNVIKRILDEESVESAKSPSNHKLTNHIRELIVEHLRNVIMVLSSFGILKGLPEEYTDGSISDQTWSLIEDMVYCKRFVNEWKSAAAKPASETSSQ